MAWSKVIWTPGDGNPWDQDDINRHEEGIDEALSPGEVPRAVGAGGEPAFNAAWQNYGGGFAPAAFWKKANGEVKLRGFVKPVSTTTLSGTTVVTLPAGYRPPYTVVGALVAFTTTVAYMYGEWNVTAAGAVVPFLQSYSGGGISWVSLDSIPAFRVDA